MQRIFQQQQMHHLCQLLSSSALMHPPASHTLSYSTSTVKTWQFKLQVPFAPGQKLELGYNFHPPAASFLISEYLGMWGPRLWVWKLWDSPPRVLGQISIAERGEVGGCHVCLFDWLRYLDFCGPDALRNTTDTRRYDYMIFLKTLFPYHCNTWQTSSKYSGISKITPTDRMLEELGGGGGFVE